MHFSFFGENISLLWTVLLLLLRSGISDSLDLSDPATDVSDLEAWKNDLNLNDELISKLYDEVNNFLIRKDLVKDGEKVMKSDDSFEVRVPKEQSFSDISDDVKDVDKYLEESGHSKHKRSPCYGFQDGLSCFRSYLALWMLQRQGLKDPISLRNIGKRAYSFRNIGKRLYSFRNIGKRGFFRNIVKRNSAEENRNEQNKRLTKRDIRFPRSYFRNIGKRDDDFQRNERMAFRNIGKKLSFRNIGKREPAFDRESRMSFRNIGKRDPFFEREDRMAFRNIGKRMYYRNIGKRNSGYERFNRMSFRNIGKRVPLFERDERMAFRNIGKRDPLFPRDERMAFRNIGKKDQWYERDDRMAFRNIGKRNDADLNTESSSAADMDSGNSRTIRALPFRNIGKRNSDDVQNISDVL